jgi:hypothetical protein
VEIGVVCGRCDRYSPLGAKACTCGASLASPGIGRPRRSPESACRSGDLGAARRHIWPRQAQTATSRSPARASRRVAPVAVSAQHVGSALSSSRAFDDEASALVREASQSRDDADPEELMEQAKNYVCRSCSTPVPAGPQVLRALRGGHSARHPRPSHAVFRPAPDAGQGQAHPDPRRRHRRAQLPAQRRATRRRAQRADCLSRTTRSCPRITRTFSTAAASSSCATRARVTASSGACTARSRSLRATSFLAGEQLFNVEGPPKTNDGPAPGRNVFLFVAQAPDALQDHPGARARGARHGGVRARPWPADRPRGR